MSSSLLYRLCGVALIIGGITAIVTTILSIFIVPPPLASGAEGPPPAPIMVVELLQWILFAFATPGLYLKQANRAGWFGFLAFVLLFLTFLLSVGVSVSEGIFVPVLALPAVEPTQIRMFVALRGFLGIPTFFITGVTVYRAGVFPRGAGILLMFAALIVLNLFHLPLMVITVLGAVSAVAIFLGFIWCGYALLVERSKPAAQSGQEGSKEIKQVSPELS